MNNHLRLEKAFKRKGIQVTRANNIVTLTRPSDNVSATVLLPEALPLEEKAVSQLLNFAAVQVPESHGHVCKACATPDFHPGGIAPVGSIVATSPDMVIPAAIGTDINCGMRLITTGLSLDKAQERKDQLTESLTRVLLQNGRDVPMTANAFKALFDSGEQDCLDELSQDGLWHRVNKQRLFNETAHCIGLDEISANSRYAPSPLLSTDRRLLRDPNLGTTGSGNHFVELQIVDGIIDRHIAWQQGLKIGDVVVMIHSGSRDVGFFVGQRWMDRAKEAWPKHYKVPESGLYGLCGPLAQEYLQAMGVAARYAWLNRVVLAELVRDCLSEVYQQDESTLVVDVPHNVVLQEQGMNIHRKGATPARTGDLALIPGSMGDYSYLVSGLGHPDWLWSCSHGAGRRMRRQAIRAIKPSTEAHLNWHCVTLREERRIEEAPGAYKNIGPVIDAQEHAGLISPAVRLRPWITFKA
jgi:tRNA-splicing ligase RtcB